MHDGYALLCEVQDCGVSQDTKLTIPAQHKVINENLCTLGTLISTTYQVQIEKMITFWVHRFIVKIRTS